MNIVEQGISYGPGSNYQIDTTKPFHAQIEFYEKAFRTTFTQGDNSQKMESVEDYMTGLSDQLNGKMAFVMSNWGGDASWLWKDKCTGTCNWPTLSFTNIKVSTGGASPTPSPPTPSPFDPSDYDFGDACKTKDADDCAAQQCPSVDHCKWSWSKTDPQKWSGNTAHCRCDAGVSPTPTPPTPGPINPSDYDFGDACKTKSDDDCATMNCPSVDHCKWSWSKTDPDKWSGKTAHCRCDEVV